VNVADAQHASDQDEGTRRGAWARLIGRYPGASLITLAAFLAFVLSVILWFTDSRQEALFTGLSVASILAFGAFYAALRRDST
jgi:1,4-dihydroxy-2-naphthoate octaprenyltransferase